MKRVMRFFLTVALLVSCAACSDPSAGNTAASWWTEEDRKWVISELNRTTAALRNEIDLLTQAQWNFRENPDRWSIAEIVEHLEMQNQLHYREISVVANAPQYLKYRSTTQGNDAHFSRYSVDTTRSKAQWFLEPLGRFGTKEAGAAAFFRARKYLTQYVAQTGVDLRKQFTFRTPVAGKSLADLQIGQVRDLHQLLLTGIAHTDRHLRQIEHIKGHPDYPQ